MKDLGVNSVLKKSHRKERERNFDALRATRFWSGILRPTNLERLTTEKTPPFYALGHNSWTSRKEKFHLLAKATALDT